MKAIIKFAKKNMIFKRDPIDHLLGRKEMEQMNKLLKPNKASVFTPETIDGINIEWITGPYIEEENTDKVIYYFHGGGFFCGNIGTHRAFGSYISVLSKVKVLLIDYSLAPEKPFPAALNDLIAVYDWLLKTKNINPKNIILGGDSAGGGLLFSFLLKLKELNLTLPAGGFAISPWVDLSCSGDSMVTCKDQDPMLEPPSTRSAANLYLNGEDPKNPLCSPLFGDLSGLPPLLIIVGTREILLDDSIRISEKLKASKVEVELDIWDGMIHDFAIYPPMIKESKQAQERIANFINKRWNKNL